MSTSHRSHPSRTTPHAARANRLVATALAAATLCLATTAQAQAQAQNADTPVRSPSPINAAPASDDLTLVLGTKLWANRWTSWSVRSTNSNLATLQVIEPVNSGTSVSFIPQLSARYRDYLASLSIMTTTNYTIDHQWDNTSLHGNRSELDFNAGYYLTPGLAATVGVKRMTQNFGGKFTWTGPTIGLSATAPLSPNLSSYLAVGLGWMKASLGNPDGSGNTSLRSDYVLSEAGLAYSVGNMGLSLVRSAALTVGYRSQVLTTKGYVLNDTNTPKSSTKQNVRDTTQGFTVGLVAAF